MKINDAASADASGFREPYIGMQVYVDKIDHERYYERKKIIIDEMRGDTIGEIIQENIEAYCRDSMFELWPAAMAYVPWQSFRDIYGPEDAFQAGTIFAELDLPFLGGGGR